MTSTVFNNYTSNNSLDSNAKEDNGKIYSEMKTRAEFNENVTNNINRLT